MKNVISFKVESVYFNSVLPFKINLSSLLSKKLADNVKEQQNFYFYELTHTHISYTFLFECIL